MTRQEILQAETVAIYSGFCEIEIKNANCDEVEFVANAWIGKPSTHKVKVYYDTKRPYFIYHDMRIHLDECLIVRGGRYEKYG